MEPESDPAASSSLHSPGELTTRTRGAPRARSTSMRIPAVSRRPAPAPLCGTRSASAPARCAGAPASTTCSDPNQEPGGTAGTKAAALPAKPRAAQARVLKARHIRVSHKESKPRPGPPIPDTAGRIGLASNLSCFRRCPFVQSYGHPWDRETRWPGQDGAKPPSEFSKLCSGQKVYDFTREGKKQLQALRQEGAPARRSLTPRLAKLAHTKA